MLAFICPLQSEKNIYDSNSNKKQQISLFAIFYSHFCRMGSFTAIPKAKGEANPDEDLDFPETSVPQMLARCRKELSGLPSPFQRTLRPNSIVASKGKSRPNLRVLQWNQLSQTLGTQNDGFVRCPLPALEWRTRRWRLLEELVRHQPDILCLQEVCFLFSIMNPFL